MFQSQRPHRVSRMEVQLPQEIDQEGQRLMIIKLRKYNQIGALLKGNEISGSQVHICYQDGSREVQGTTAAVHKGVVGMEA